MLSYFLVSVNTQRLSHTSSSSPCNLERGQVTQTHKAKLKHIIHTDTNTEREREREDGRLNPDPLHATLPTDHKKHVGCLMCLCKSLWGQKTAPSTVPAADQKMFPSPLSHWSLLLSVLFVSEHWWPQQPVGGTRRALDQMRLKLNRSGALLLCWQIFLTWFGDHWATEPCGEWDKCQCKHILQYNGLPVLCQVGEKSSFAEVRSA